jgi:hypothetical protein
VLIYLVRKMGEIGVTDSAFFPIAYVSRFKRHIDVSEGVSRFRFTAHMPRYVDDFCHHLQKGL